MNPPPEDELIKAVARLLSGSEPGVVVGLGDDAAVVEPGAGQLVLTMDLLAEGVHFQRGAISARDLGAKAITVNVSDVAAMAASPRYALVALAVPNDVEAAWVMELVGGMRDACAEYALALVGGDTNRADLVVVSVAVAGEVAPGRAVLRSGARVGDRIVVTGSLGAAAGGLALSRAASGRAAEALSQPWGRALIEALERPVARVGEAQLLARAGATAMMNYLGRPVEGPLAPVRSERGRRPRRPDERPRGRTAVERGRDARGRRGGARARGRRATSCSRPSRRTPSSARARSCGRGSASTCPRSARSWRARHRGRGRRRRDGAARTRGMESLRPRVAWSRERRRSAAAPAGALDRRLRLGRRRGNPGLVPKTLSALGVFGMTASATAVTIQNTRGRHRLRSPAPAGRRRADPRGRHGHRGRRRQDRDAGVRGDRRGGRRRRRRDADSRTSSWIRSRSPSTAIACSTRMRSERSGSESCRSRRSSLRTCPRPRP